MKIPISAGIKEPMKRVIDLSNNMMKRFYEKNPDALRTFLAAVGFTQLSQNRYQFVKPAPPLI